MRGLDDVIKKDPAYDTAGAYRSLGKVLIEAPSWAGLGDKKRGLDLLKKAVETAPGSAVNRLYLAQAYAANNKYPEAKREAVAVISAPPGDDLKEYAENRREAQKLLATLPR